MQRKEKRRGEVGWDGIAEVELGGGRKKREGGDDDAILRNSGELNTHFEKCAPARRVTKGGGRRGHRDSEGTTDCVNGAINVLPSFLPSFLPSP